MAASRQDRIRSAFAQTLSIGPDFTLCDWLPRSRLSRLVYCAPSLQRRSRSTIVRAFLSALPSALRGPSYKTRSRPILWMMAMIIRSDMASMRLTADGPSVRCAMIYEGQCGPALGYDGAQSAVATEMRSKALFCCTSAGFVSDELGLGSINRLSQPQDFGVARL